MIVSVWIAAVLIFILLIVLIRFNARMAALIAWVVSTVSQKLTGARESSETTSKETKKESVGVSVKKPTQKLKNRQRGKKSEDPTFSTSLSIPIEEVIEETINENLNTEVELPETTNVSQKRNAKKKKPVQVIQKDIRKKQEKNTKECLETPSEELTDELGFSFLPVKEKSKKSKPKLPTEKKKSDEEIKEILEQGIKKKHNSRSLIIDHYKTKVTSKKIVNTEKPREFVLVNTVEEKFQTFSKTELKESKKVDSGISYASIVTNKFVEGSQKTDSNTSEETEYCISSSQEISKGNSVSSIEVISTSASGSQEELVGKETEEPIRSDSFVSIEKQHQIVDYLDKLLKEEQIQFESEEKTAERFLSEDILNYTQHQQNQLNCSSKSIEIAEEAFEQKENNSLIITKDQFSKSENIITDSSKNLHINCLKEETNLKNHIDINTEAYFEEKITEENSFVDEITKRGKETLILSESRQFQSSSHNNNFKQEKTSFIEINNSLHIQPNGLIQNGIGKSETKLQDTKIVYNNTENYNLNDTRDNLLNGFIKDTNCKLKETISFPKEFSHLEESSEDIAQINKEDPSIMSQVRVLTLNDKEHQECTIYRIEKNWKLQFRLGPTLLGRKVKLYCNYPEEIDGKLTAFNRSKYHLLKWCQDEGCKHADDTALLAYITAKIAGSFHYYFLYENDETNEKQGSGYFLVDPVLKYGENEVLLLDSVQCQTVLAKSLGSFSTWENKLLVAKESGYNMIHFTPIQELGASNSSYSLSEQLKFNPIFNEKNGSQPTFEDVEEFISGIRKNWKVTSICDIVLNHTANESEWLKTHPEVTYNCVNCPYLRPAYLLDAALHQFSIDISKGIYEDRGIPLEINTEDHLNAFRYHFKVNVLDTLKIHELFIADAERYIQEFLNLARKVSPVAVNANETEELNLIQNAEYKRLESKIDMDLALRLYNVYRNDSFDEETRLKRCSEEFKQKVDALNKTIIDEVNKDLNAALDNVIAGIRYYRLQSDGPKFKEITIKTPLVYRYFTDHGSPKSIKDHEDLMYSDKGAFLMAHNGWVMASDPLKNFAAPGTKTYIRRELIAWGDSVKLRYGDKPEDCPFLWEHMRKYVEQTARIFDGVRLDNCHSTPIPVAEYLLDCARMVRPDLYVVAELFTNSDLTDNIFVNRLGITSLIREAMSAWDSHEEGRLVYRYGGVPVGSFYQPRIRPLMPTVAHALFLDLTHDNPSPIEKRSVFDLLPSTALVNMACCASGSNRGYDELVPHHIHVVDETREYAEWTSDETLTFGNVKYVTNKSGIISAKRALNQLHFKLGKEGYSQVYVDQIDPDIVAVTRHRPDTHESYVLVAFTAFSHPSEDSGKHQRGIKPLRIEGTIDEVVLEASLGHINEKSGGSKFAKYEEFIQDSQWINGLSEYQVTLKEHIQVIDSDILEKVDSGALNVTQLNFRNFKPGSIVVVKVSLPKEMGEAVSTVRSLLNSFSATKDTELKEIVSRMTLSDLNRAIYRCHQEERDEGFGFDVYNIPNFQPMVYAGFQGFMSLLANIRPNNDLGHPMCCNLRDGNWMIEYIWKRLKLDEGSKELGQWFEENTKCFNTLPRYLVPCYFDAIVTGIYVTLIEHSWSLMLDFIKHGSTFVRGLALGSLQFAAYIKSADLPKLSPNLAPPKPPTKKNEQGEEQACVTLSAGLPHFSVGYMRNWGRDTFISIRGLFLLTGRFEEARQHILGYAACLRHGLIPNLLDGGRNSRFNCRDAVWWWLYCIREYTKEAPNGVNILSDKVSRLFPTDDSPPQPPGAVEETLAEVIQEALQVHFQGLVFRERNAGRQIDEHMTDRGFNNQIGIHPETGFVFGGNEWNCGTWMDKMGSSDKAGNRGKPATPRDGSAVELIGLSKATLSWLWKLSQEKKYPYESVERIHKNGTTSKWTFKEWSDKIQNNFEKYFWVNTTPVQDEIRPDLVNKRGIYKDCYGASQAWTDFQLRCNFPIAMVAAPELFNPQHAWTALKNAEKYLLGPLGMKTLDPEDWAYRGDYDNSNDSGDPNVAHGFNYHQGPEWVWPIGYFLRARLIFAASNGALNETVASTKVILSKHFTELQTCPWRGLPELTNSNGAECRDSSKTQAWSMACVLEVLHDLQQIEAKKIPIN